MKTQNRRKKREEIIIIFTGQNQRDIFCFQAKENRERERERERGNVSHKDRNNNNNVRMKKLSFIRWGGKKKGNGKMMTDVCVRER